jgi:hypothetical protein
MKRDGGKEMGVRIITEIWSDPKHCDVLWGQVMFLLRVLVFSIDFFMQSQRVSPLNF